MDERVLLAMSAPALREYIRSQLSKKNKPADDKQSDESDKEREALADLHEETNGTAPKVPVTKEDMPFDIGEDDESGDEASEASAEADADDEKPAKTKKRSKE
jgi:hypothetical protein